MLDPGVDISVTSLAENARDGGGYSRFVLLDTRLDKDVADAAPFFEPRKVKTGSKDLEEMQMEKERSALLTTMEKNKS